MAKKVSKKQTIKEKTEQKAGGMKGDIKSFFGNILGTETSLSDIPPTSYFFALHGYKGLASACIDVIANSVASNEWYLLKPDSEKRKIYENKPISKARRPLPDEIVSEEDNIYKLLLKPNPIFDWFEFIKFHQIFMEIKGESYWWLAKNKLGQIVEVWLIPPFFVNPIKDPTKRDNPYSIDKFDVNVMGGIMSLSTDEVIYFRNPNPYNPLRGIGTLEKAVIERDLNLFSKIYARNFFKNGGIPAGVLSTEQRMTAEDVEEIRRLWRDQYGGLDNSWKIALLWGGWKFTPISVDPSAREFERLGEWSRDDLLAVFGVPASKLGIVKDVNRANALVNDITFAKETVLPRLKQLESKLNYEFFPKIGANGYYFMFTDPTPQNVEINIRKLRYGAMFGILTINEARDLIGLPPIEGGDDTFVQPLKGIGDKINPDNIDRFIEKVLNGEEFEY